MASWASSVTRPSQLVVSFMHSMCTGSRWLPSGGDRSRPGHIGVDDDVERNEP